MTGKTRQSLRKRLANSRRLNRAVVRGLAGYFNWCHRRTRWDRPGFAELQADLRNGPVIMALWHEHIAFSPFMFDHELGRICSLTSNARAGRLAGQIQAEFGFETVAMQSRASNIATSRAVMRMIRNGASIGVAVDGPRGPRREAKTVALEWARMTGAPIWLCGFAATGTRRLGSWDRMLFPRPFARGVMGFQRWNADIPRRPSDAEMETLRQGLETALNALDARLTGAL